MKLVIGIVVAILVVSDIAIYFNLKKFMKKHENELLEDVYRGLMCRAIPFIAISVCICVLSVAVQFVS